MVVDPDGGLAGVAQGAPDGTWRARRLHPGAKRTPVAPGVHAGCHLACTPETAATAAACKLPWPRPEPRTSIFMGLDCKNERSNGLDLGEKKSSF
jgi:hypothetical protein